MTADAERLAGERSSAGPSLAELSDGELIRRCQKGDVSAFEVLLVRYQNRVYNLAYRMTGHHDDAQDVTQEVFLRALENIGRFRQEAQVYTWLFRIAVNQAISRRRRQQRLKFVPIDGGQGDDDSSAGRQLPAAATESPESAAQRNERHEQVSRAIAELDDEFRAVLVLKDIEGLDYQEIADTLELPLGTVKSRLHRARCELKDKLKPIADW